MRTYKTPLFQKRHYNYIAQMLADISQHVSVTPELITAISIHLKGTNPNYNSQRFRDACYADPKTTTRN